MKHVFGFHLLHLHLGALATVPEEVGHDAKRYESVAYLSHQLLSHHFYPHRFYIVNF